MLRRINGWSLKQKLIRISMMSFIARVITFLALPQTPTTLAPDEGTYAAIVQWTAESMPADKFPNFGAGLYLSGRSFFLPANAIYRLGFPPLDAVRITASLYGFLSLALLIFLTLKLSRIGLASNASSKYNENLIALLFMVFAFLPSHFVWSNLGLREATNEFWLLVGFLSLFVMHNLGRRHFVIAASTLFISIVFTFSTRPQTGWLIGLTALIYLISKFRFVETPFLIAIVLLGVILGTTGTTGTTGLYGPKSIINLIDRIPSEHKENQVQAASTIETLDCPLEQTSVINRPPDRVRTYLCVLWQAPYMSSTFLLRPFIATDVTSTASLMAALENIIWSIALFLIVYMIVKRRGIPHFDKLIPSLIFFTLYVIGAGAYEGNMGTAFRHKSLILWVVLATLLALFWRDSQEVQEDSRGKSTESAV